MPLKRPRRCWKLPRRSLNVMIIPMPDYRPKYPKIDPEEVINPNHPNLTIWGNKIEACIFIGVHCHYANLTLKMIRAGTNCCTMAICAEQGHEDAMLTIRDSDTAQVADGWRRSSSGCVKRWESSYRTTAKMSALPAHNRKCTAGRLTRIPSPLRRGRCFGECGDVRPFGRTDEA